MGLLGMVKATRYVLIACQASYVSLIYYEDSHASNHLTDDSTLAPARSIRIYFIRR